LQYNICRHKFYNPARFTVAGDTIEIKNPEFFHAEKFGMYATERATVYVAVCATVYATFVILTGSVHATVYSTEHPTVYATFVILTGIRPRYEEHYSECGGVCCGTLYGVRYFCHPDGIRPL
jgi:hypothetical protein